MNKVYSDFELDQMGIKLEGSENYIAVNCVGSSEEEMNTRVITKNCRGTVAKTIVRGTGTGKLKLKAHIPYDVHVGFFGMELDSLMEGVKAYGRNSRHKGFAVTQHVLDEDGIVKLKAYPNCIMTSGVARKIENGATEVAELELEADIMPDEYGNGMYEVLEADLSDATVKEQWMTAFTPEMVQINAA